MKPDDAQAIWTDYYLRKKAQRVEEATVLWKCMRAAGVQEDTDLAIDFTLFGTSKANVHDLAKQLSENYEVNVSDDVRPEYWLAKATTRPYPVTLSREQLIAWVDFIADVAQSYACLFSTWKVEALALGQSFLRGPDRDVGRWSAKSSRTQLTPISTSTCFPSHAQKLSFAKSGCRLKRCA